MERYRDLSDGSFSRILFAKKTDMYIFDARAENIGYRDQRYRAGYGGGKLQFTARLRLGSAELLVPHVHAVGGEVAGPADP